MNNQTPQSYPEFNPPPPEEAPSGSSPDAQAPEQDTGRTLSAIGNFIYEAIKTTALIVVVAFLIRHFLIQPFIVEGESMEPNFHDGEYILIEKVSAYFHDYKRGDVVVFKFPGNTKLNFIKRVIGLPGEKIEIKDGEVTIYNQNYPKGKKLEEDYLAASKKQKTNIKIVEEMDDNQYFVMGDNRNESSDSREWGVLDENYITGRAFVAIYPPGAFGLIKNPDYSLFSLKKYYKFAENFSFQ